MATMRMAHAVDPRDDLMNKVKNYLGDVEVFNNQILVAVYVRPSVTAGGIHIPDQTRKEDEFQGKVGLVLKMGKLAFQDDDKVSFHGQKVEPGDWITFRVHDGWQLKVNGVLCRLLDDVDVKLRITSPDIVY